MRRTALFCALLALVAAPVHAGVFDDEEARRQIRELRAETLQTVETLRQRIDGAVKNQLDFANLTESVRADLARLTGQVEVLTHAVESAHKRQQDFYVDLDNRLRKLETAATPPAPAPAAPSEPKPDPQAEMRDYEAALGHFRTGKFKEAQAAFETFLTTHTKSSLLPNAHYWLGSSLYQQKQYPRAAEAFARVAADWPADAKAPDALLAQGNALVEAKDTKAAIRAWETLVDKYSASPAAESARSRLKALVPPPPPAKKR